MVILRHSPKEVTQVDESLQKSAVEVKIWLLNKATKN